MEKEENGGKHIVFRVKCCLDRGQSELEEFINFGYKSKIITVDFVEGMELRCLQ